MFNNLFRYSFFLTKSQEIWLTDLIDVLNVDGFYHFYQSFYKRAPLQIGWLRMFHNVNLYTFIKI